MNTSTPQDKTYSITIAVPKQDVVYSLQLANDLYRLTTKEFTAHYLRCVETRRWDMYIITTKYPNEENLKKILFKAGLKSTSGVKVR